MPSTFKYIMECYFYQDWQLEFSKSTEVLIFFAERESMEIVNNLIDDIKYIINNNLSEKIFEGDKFDFNPLLCGYSSEKKWFELAYKTLVDEISKRK